MSRLWERGARLDERIERFTVGRDPELDLHLVACDALASMAHAVMLARIGVLAEVELEPLRAELAAIAAEARAGTFAIAREQEDGHTAIENRLTERLGETGRRIHTGRSRNDQVIAALRLWGRERMLQQTAELLRVVTQLLALAERHREVPLPGYSHGRQAMPSTAGFLFAAHASSLLDHLPWLDTAFQHLDRSPLGSASGFGVALPLDRELVAELLAFSRVELNTLAVQNDRGRAEALCLGVGAALATDLARLAGDLVWFSSDELACLRLSEEVTTGSSIMPHKRNPDVLELVRAGAARLRGQQAQVAGIYGPLPSGYHRDLQLTKEPFLAGMEAVVDLLAVIQPVLAGLTLDAERCRQVMTRAIGATDAVYDRVAAGEPFRTAYRAVAVAPDEAVVGDPAEGWRRRTHSGAAGALDLRPDQGRLELGRARLADQAARCARAWRLLDPVDPER